MQQYLVLSSDLHCKENDGTTGAAHLIDFFLAKNETPVVRQAPYSPDTTPCDFWLFPPGGLSNNVNPTRALITTSLKCYLSATGAIDRRENIHACI